MKARTPPRPKNQSNQPSSDSPTLELADTHCHIHSADYALDADEVINAARADGVTRLLCVGNDADDSRLAVEFVQTREGCWASLGIHPHEARHMKTQWPVLESLVGRPKVVAIGECGLDYYYEHSPRSVQVKLLEAHIELAVKHKLPLIFHVRDAFRDFWPVLDNYRGEKLRGVVHSFTADRGELDQVLQRGLFLGINGIATFTKIDSQLEAIRGIPLENLLLETDAPFLTPAPLRGNINEPKHVCLTAEFLSGLRDEPLAEITAQTTINAITLFGI